MLTDEQRQAALDWLLKQTLKTWPHETTVMRYIQGDVEGRLNLKVTHLAMLLADYLATFCGWPMA
jgi:hypothetical protein